jgi:LPXTG-motif cell wall-anchored protein
VQISTGSSHVIKIGSGSFLMLPESSPDFPLPEMSSVILLGFGLAGLVSFFIIKRKKNNSVVKPE